MPRTIGRVVLLPTLIALSTLVGVACGSDTATEPRTKEKQGGTYVPPPPIAWVDVVATDVLLFTGQSAAARDLILRVRDSTGGLIQSPTIDFKAPCHSLPLGPPCYWGKDGDALVAPSMEAQALVVFHVSGGLGSNGERPTNLSDLVGVWSDEAADTAVSFGGPDSTGNPVMVRVTAAIDLRAIPWLAHWTCAYDSGVVQDEDGASIDSIRFLGMRSGSVIYSGATWQPNDGALALMGWTGTELRFREDGRVDTLDTTTFLRIAAQAPDTLFLAAGHGNPADSLHRDRWPAVLDQREPRRYIGGTWCGPDAREPGAVTIEEATTEQVQ